MRTYSFLGSSTAFCPCRCRSRCCFLKENERISMVLHVQMSSRGQCWACAGRWPRGSGFIGYYIGNGHEQHAVHFSSSATWSEAERQLVQAGKRNGNMRTRTQTKGQGSVLIGGGVGGTAVVMTIDGGEEEWKRGVGLSQSLLCCSCTCNAQHWLRHRKLAGSQKIQPELSNWFCLQTRKQDCSDRTT